MNTKIVRIGKLTVGGKYPVRVKGMLKTPANQISKLIAEAKQLQNEGAQALRLAVKEAKDADLAAVLKKHIIVPLAADIHFHPYLAKLAIEKGFDQIRLNPKNITCQQDIKDIAVLAKRNKVSIRVGINSGGFKEAFKNKTAFSRAMVKTAAECLRPLEKQGFYDIMVSLKGADVLTSVLANRVFSKHFDYPLHLGITATGPFVPALIKSAMGLGILLSEGIGNIIRVSLTAPSFWEIRAAKYILSGLDIQHFGPELISCPACSRCEVNLIKIVNTFSRELSNRQYLKPLKIAVMGCVVNGPGEASQADIGVAFGKNKGAIFRKGKILGMTNQAEVINDLFKKLEEYGYTCT